MDDIPFYPSKVTVPRYEFTTAGTAFATYIFGALLLIGHRSTEAFLLLTMALTVNLLDAYTFPLLNWLSGRRESLLLGTVGREDHRGTPDGIFFFRFSKHTENRKKTRILYRLGFTGGVILTCSSITHLFLLTVPPLFLAAGSILALSGLLSCGMYSLNGGGKDDLLKIKAATGKLLCDEGFNSWIIILTGGPSHTRRFLARHRKLLLTTGLVFVQFEDGIDVDRAKVSPREGILTGYRAHPGLVSAIVAAGAKHTPTLTRGGMGLDLDCLNALARGFKAVSVSFSTGVAPSALCDSLSEVNRIQCGGGRPR